MIAIMTILKPKRLQFWPDWDGLCLNYPTAAVDLPTADAHIHFTLQGMRELDVQRALAALWRRNRHGQLPPNDMPPESPCLLTLGSQGHAVRSLLPAWL